MQSRRSSPPFSCLLASCPDLPAQEKKPTPGPVEKARTQLQAGKTAKAGKILADYVRINGSAPDIVEANFLLAKAQAAQNQPDDAIRILNWIISSQRNTEWAAQSHEELAKLQDLRKNRTAAQQIRQDLLRNYPDSPSTLRVWVTTADQLFLEENFKESAALYEKFASKLPPESAKNYELARILATSGGDSKKLLAIANLALDQNKLSLAKTVYQQLAKSKQTGSDLSQVETKLGWCLYLEGNEKSQASAERLWKGVIARSTPGDPWRAESKWHLVVLEAGPRSNLPKAVAICEEISKEEARGTFPHEQALFARAWLLTMSKKWEAALVAFDDLEKAYPEKLLHPPIKKYREIALEGSRSKRGTP